MATTYELSHLRTLEAESIHTFRDVAAEFERPVLLFSGGKDVVAEVAATRRTERGAGAAGMRV